jgi:uncharacterized protein YbcI
LSEPAPKDRKVAFVSTDEQQQPSAAGGHVSVLMEISNLMVRLHKEQFGRGPTAARSNWAGDHTIVCELTDTLVPAERNLVKMGEHQRLRDLRMFFQYSSVREFCEPVERITGRKVKAFMSAIDTEANGYVSEIFVFHPEGYEGPSRIEHAEP